MVTLNCSQVVTTTSTGSSIGISVSGLLMLIAPRFGASDRFMPSHIFSSGMTLFKPGISSRPDRSSNLQRRRRQRMNDRLIKRDEDRELDDQRQTAAQRVDAILAVEAHLFLRQLLAVVLVFLLQLLQLRLKLLHRRRRTLLLRRQREGEQANQHREDDDRQHHIVVEHRIQKGQQSDKWIEDKIHAGRSYEP